MTAVFCKNAADRTAATWAEQLEPFDRLEFAVSDAARGIARAVADTATARREAPEAPDLEHGLDLFHTAMEAHRVLARSWRRAEAAWEAAEAADTQVASAKRRGLDARGAAWAARSAWAERSRRSRRPIGSKQPGGAPTRRWTCSAPTAGSTTAPTPRPQSPRRWST